MGRKAVGLIAFLVSVGLLLAACSTAPSAAPTTAPAAAPAKAAAPASAPTTAAAAPTAAPAAAATTAPAAKLPVIKAHYFGPETAYSGRLMKQWANEVTTKSNNRVQFEWYYNATLMPDKEQPEGIQGNVFQFAMLGPGYHPGKTPLWTVGNLPFVSASNAAATKALFDLRDMEPMKAELAKYNAMTVFAFVSPYMELVSKKPIDQVGDFKGLRIRTLDATQTKVLETLGATGVSVPASELYQALDKNTVDAALFSFDSARTYKLYEVSKYGISWGYGGAAAVVVMNQGTFNSMPADVQKIITDAGKTTVSELWPKMLQTDLSNATDALGKAGVKLSTLPAAEIAKIQGTTVALRQSWAKDADAKGMPGTAVLNQFTNLVSKYEKQ